MRKKLARCLLLSVVCISVPSCRPDTATDASRPASAAQPSGALSARVQPPPTLRSVRPEEREFFELAQFAPSSAGYFIDSVGNVVVMVRDGRDDAAAIRGATALHSAGGIRLSRQGAAKIRSRRADFSFAQLASARDAVFDSIFTQLGGLSSLDLDERSNRVTIGLDPRFADEERRMVLRRAGQIGVDTALLAFRVHAPLKTTSGSALLRAPAFLSGTQLSSTYDTLIGGIAIRTDHAAGAGGGPGDCTLGFTAYYNGYRALVTATHCTTVWGAPDNTVVSQATTRRVGVEAVDPNKYHCGLNWCRASDASLFRIDDSIPSIRGLIARTTYRNSGGPNGGNGSTTIDGSSPFFTVTGAGTTLTTGMEVQRIGRTSGWVYGTISNTCVDHHYDGSETGPFSVYTMVCGYEAAMENLGGDSGGPLFRWTGGDSVTLEGTVVGQLTTQDEVFSKFTRIASDFGGSMVVTRTGAIPSLSVSIVGPSLVRTNQTTCTWTAQVSGGVLAYTYAWKKNGVAIGSNSPYLQLASTGTSSFTLSVDVTDAESTLRSKSLAVTVSGSAAACEL